MKLISLFSLLIVTNTSFSQTGNAEIDATMKFEEVFNYISSMYVDDVKHDELTDAAIIALLEKLDPGLDRALFPLEIQRRNILQGLLVQPMLLLLLLLPL